MEIASDIDLLLKTVKKQNWLESTGEKFLDLLVVIRKNLLAKWYYLLTPLLSEKSYLEYDTITLKLYLQIVETGNYKLLQKTGNEAVIPELYERWEKILEESNKATGNEDYTDHNNLIKDYNLTIADYTYTKATIIMLLLKFDKELVDELVEGGYAIKIGNNEEFAESLNLALSKVNSLISIAASLLLEIQGNKKSKADRKVTFMDLIVNLELVLERSLEDNILLCKYNALCAGVRKRQSKKPKKHGGQD